MPEPTPHGSVTDIAPDTEVRVFGRVRWAARCRPAKGQEACGDAYLVFQGENAVTAAVVDGLGHGPDAEQAAQTVIAYLQTQFQTHPNRPLDDLMQGCHRTLSGTRGAAVAFCRLEPDRGRMLFCGVGNVTLRSYPDRRGLGISLPGVVGYRMRRVRVFECELNEGDLVTMFTDGISGRFPMDAFAALGIVALVTRVEAEFGKDHDDATLVALRITSEEMGPP